MGGVCGRYVSARTEPDLIGEYQVSRVDVRERVEPSWNVAPTREVYVVRRDGGDRVLGSARWGLVPAWAATPAGGARMINARLETVGQRPAFRQALRWRRCLVPADAYYEWARDADGVRRPFALRAADGGGLTFAGLYETWRDRTRDRDDPRALLTTVTIVTTAAVGVAATVHDRMPVLLSARARDRWLDPALTDPALVLDMVAGLPAVDLVAEPADPAVGDVRVDGPHLLLAPPLPAGDAAPTLF